MGGSFVINNNPIGRQLVSKVCIIYNLSICKFSFFFPLPSKTVKEPVSESLLEPLIHLLLSSDPDVQKASSLALSNLALHGPGRLPLSLSLSLSLFVSLSSTSTYCVFLYSSLAKNKTTIVECGALRPLIVQLSTDNAEVQCNACGCITTLATVGKFTKHSAMFIQFHT